MDEEQTIEDDLSGMAQKSKPQSIKSSILDKYTIQEKLVPSLKAIKTKEPAVMMAALNVFRQVGTIADTDFLALEVLPVLWSFSLGPLLDLRQFGDFMALIKTISSKVEREQTKKLQELSSGGTSSGFQNGVDSSSKASHNLQVDTDSTRDNFERLVLGRGHTGSADQDASIGGALFSEMQATQQPPQQSTTATTPWPSNIASTIGRGDLSRQSSFNVRSITPDYNLSSFPSLEPASSSRQKSPQPPAFPALQPSSSTSWGMANSSTSQSPVLGNGMSSPSLGAMASMKTTNSSMSGSISQPAAPNYSAFSIPPPPSSQTTSPSITGGLANSGRSTFGTSTASNAFLQNTTPQAQSPPRQGLDKYESLL